jgi:pimeloyl-ACP methyl ester carboxylesterase
MYERLDGRTNIPDRRSRFGAGGSRDTRAGEGSRKLPPFQSSEPSNQPKTLIVWGKNDYIFPPEGATPYKRDLPDVETHLLDTGHFALETHGEEIASRIEHFFEHHG